MEHEKIIKDERGTIKIRVSLVTFSFGNTDRNGNHFRYDVRVSHIPPKKRTEVLNETIATESEILNAKTELWNLIKP